LRRPASRSSSCSTRSSSRAVTLLIVVRLGRDRFRPADTPQQERRVLIVGAGASPGIINCLDPGGFGAVTVTK